MLLIRVIVADSKHGLTVALEAKLFILGYGEGITEKSHSHTEHLQSQVHLSCEEINLSLQLLTNHGLHLSCLGFSTVELPATQFTRDSFSDLSFSFSLSPPLFFSVWPTAVPELSL